MLKTAIMAALAAGKILDKHFGRLDSIQFKNKKKTDFVTRADKEAEKKIKKIILGKFPGHSFWGEESGQKNANKKYLWVVDPLDGTSNFVFNIPMFSVSIALLRGGKPFLGVVYIPKTQELFYAQKNKGAFCNKKRIQVSNTINLENAVCSVGYWSKNRRYLKKGLKNFSAFARRVKKMRYLSSTVFEICRVAKGDLDFCAMETTFLDIAAAKLILEEAGGTMINRYGKKNTPEFDKDIFSIIASNKKLRHEIVRTK